MKNIFLIFILLFTFSSCSKIEYFEINDIKNIVVSTSGFSTIDIDVDVKFDSNESFKFVAKKLVLKLILKGEEVVITAKLRNKVEVNSLGEYVTIPLRLQFEDGIIGAVNIIPRLKKNRDVFSIDGYIVVRKGLFSRRIKLDEVKISDIVDKMI